MFNGKENMVLLYFRLKALYNMFISSGNWSFFVCVMSLNICNT